jgi:hypothetical protein
MVLVKIQLVNRNSKKTGKYNYSPIVLIGHNYYRCNSLSFDSPTRKDQIKVKNLVPYKDPIDKKYYESNGLDEIKL